MGASAGVSMLSILVGEHAARDSSAACSMYVPPCHRMPPYVREICSGWFSLALPLHPQPRYNKAVLEPQSHGYILQKPLITLTLSL